MQDRELYEEVLGLKSPWTVSKVTLNLEEQQVDVFVLIPHLWRACPFFGGATNPTQYPSSAEPKTGDTAGDKPGVPIATKIPNEPFSLASQT